MEINKTVLAGQRAEIYHFLAVLFLRPPAPAMLSLIMEGEIDSIFPCGLESTSFSREMTGFVAELATMTDPANEMEAEHTALFVLASGVIPHEAAFVDVNKRLGGSATMAVNRFYENAVLEVNAGCVEMPDHIGMELDFLSRLCALEKLFRNEDDHDSLQVCINFQREFMERHIGRWAQQCCEKVLTKAAYGFYRAIAYYTMEFLQAENEYLQEYAVHTYKEGDLCERLSA